MTPKMRARILWAMACLVLVYALVNVIVYFASGSFGSAWFIASLVVYGAALAAAVVLLAADREKDAGPVATVQVMNVQAADPRRAAVAATSVATASTEALVVAPSSEVVVAGDKPRP